MSKQVNYNENLCSGAAIRDDKGRRISKLFEASHPKMTVGYAKNLIMPDTPTEQEFNFRQAGGGVIEDGVAVIDKVKGKSIVWNQRIKMQLAETRTINGITFTKNPYGSITASGTATANATYSIPCDSMVAGHRYLFCASDNGSASTYGFEVANKTGNDVFEFDSNLFNPTIITPSQNGIEGFFALRVWAGATVNVVYRPQSIDLTQMFGEGNEPTTYEEFLSRKPKVADEYAYNEGTIVNNKVEKIKATGVNLWDEEWENGFYQEGEKSSSSNNVRSKNLIPVIGGSNLYIDIGREVAYVTEYDKQGHYLRDIGWKNAAFSISNDAAYITFYANLEYGTTYNHDICINLSDPAINGQYFPYEKHELDLSWVKDIKDAEGVKLFEDGMKSAGTAFDELAKGKAIKRIGVKVFDGNAAIGGGEISGDAYRVLFKDSITTSESGTRNTLASNGDRVYAQYNGGYYYDKYAIGFASVNDVWFCLPSSVAQTISQVRTYLEEHPITFIYELAEPIEVEYDEKNLTYPVVAGGTEEAIASEPSTAFRADIGYGIDAVKTILDLKARVKALEGK